MTLKKLVDDLIHRIEFETHYHRPSKYIVNTEEYKALKDYVKVRKEPSMTDEEVLTALNKTSWGN